MLSNILTVHTLAGQASEVIDRIAGSYDHFVLPFVIGIVFCICWLLAGLVRMLWQLSGEDRRKLLLSLFNPKTALKNIKDLFCDCLFHTKIWKRKPWLGYMHSAIAFGWFMLIVLGHLEVYLFVPKHLSLDNGALFYPIFYRFFVWANPAHATIKGALFCFLMDFFLLYVLSGIGIAMFKRFRSIALGMKHTTKPSFADRVALYCLWGIFPLRLMAESFTADMSGGSFLTVPVNMLLRTIFGDNLYIMPWWWAYSTCLGMFFAALPFSRYMHILTEPVLILFRNAGLKARKPRKGFTEAEIYACSSCGMCLDACPMNEQKKNLRYSSVYFMRFLRRHNEKKIDRIADKCLMCGKCLAICPVGIDSPAIRRVQRASKNDKLPFDYSYLPEAVRQLGSLSAGRKKMETLPGGRKDPGSLPEGLKNSESLSGGCKERVMYFAGCMSHLTPKIIRSVETVLQKAGVEYTFADKDGGLCCGRPLLLAGKDKAAAEIIAANKKMILDSGCTLLLLSCPICYKVFKEQYALEGVEVLHYTEYFNRLARQGKINIAKGSKSYVYHDPCELGRGCGIYDAPREVISMAGELRKASKERDESVCCGGSLGSMTLSHKDRREIGQGSVSSLLYNDPDAIVTACPLCYKTFRELTHKPVLDFAELIEDSL